MRFFLLRLSAVPSCRMHTVVPSGSFFLYSIQRIAVRTSKTILTPRLSFIAPPTSGSVLFHLISCKMIAPKSISKISTVSILCKRSSCDL